MKGNVKPVIRHIASFSGGKDSTAMVLRLIEEDWPLDEIVFFDTGWEFPQMIEHVDKFEQYIGRPITRLKPHIDFRHWMLHREIIARKGPLKGKVHRIGNGWPSMSRRWCTSKKVQTIERNIQKDAVRYIGIAADEAKRQGSYNQKKYNTQYPLIKWDMSENDCLYYCYDRGFDWGGLYTHFQRVSCFCCPLQRLGELRKLRHRFPELWAKMLAWEDEMERPLRGFKDYATVHDLDARFAQEDKAEAMQSTLEDTNKCRLLELRFLVATVALVIFAAYLTGCASPAPDYYDERARYMHIAGQP